MNDQNDDKRIEEALGEPILPELDENTLRIRRNLLVVSAISIFIVAHDIRISSGNVGGIVLEGLTPESVIQALFIVTLYQFIHFNFNSWDYVRKWRVRCTGARLYFQTSSAWAANKEDASNPDQTSFYGWWLRQDKKIKRWEDSVAKIHADLETIQQEARVDWKVMETHRVHILDGLQSAITAITTMNNSFDDVRKVLDSDHFRVRLRRFDRWFWNYQREQVFRLIMIEWLLPVILGVVALACTFPTALISEWVAAAQAIIVAL